MISNSDIQKVIIAEMALLIEELKQVKKVTLRPDELKPFFETHKEEILRRVETKIKSKKDD